MSEKLPVNPPRVKKPLSEWIEGIRKNKTASFVKIGAARGSGYVVMASLDELEEKCLAADKEIKQGWKKALENVNLRVEHGPARIAAATEALALLECEDATAEELEEAARKLSNAEEKYRRALRYKPILDAYIAWLKPLMDRIVVDRYKLDGISDGIPCAVLVVDGLESGAWFVGDPDTAIHCSCLGAPTTLPGKAQGGKA